jgi:DnaK suppressor protein
VGKKTTPTKDRKAKPAAKSCKPACKAKGTSVPKRADKPKAAEKVAKSKASPTAGLKATAVAEKALKPTPKPKSGGPERAEKPETKSVAQAPKTTQEAPRILKKPVPSAHKANSKLPSAPVREPREIGGLPKAPAFRDGFERPVRGPIRSSSGKESAGGNGDNNADVDLSTGLAKTYLTETELEEFRQLLIAKRQEIIRDVTNLEDEAIRQSASGGATSSMPIHMADLGTDTWEQELTLGLIENERNLLREIDEALDRVNNKTYGMCLATNKRISKARLQAKPWAKYCIEYARRRELGLA